MYDPRFGPGWGWVVVNPAQGGGSATPEVEGRVVKDQGYTRVRPRAPNRRSRAWPAVATRAAAAAAA